MLKKIINFTNSMEFEFYHLTKDNFPDYETVLKAISIHETYEKLFLKEEKMIENLNSKDQAIYFKLYKPKIISYFFYFDAILDFEKFKTKNDYKNWYLYLEMERKKMLDFNLKYSEFIPIFEEYKPYDEFEYFNFDNCSLGVFNRKLWGELNHKLLPKIDVLFANYLFLKKIDCYYSHQLKNSELYKYYSDVFYVKWNGSTVHFVELTIALIESKLLLFAFPEILYLDAS